MFVFRRRVSLPVLPLSLRPPAAAPPPAAHHVLHRGDEVFAALAAHGVAPEHDDVWRLCRLDARFAGGRARHGLVRRAQGLACVAYADAGSSITRFARARARARARRGRLLCLEAAHARAAAPRPSPRARPPTRRPRARRGERQLRTAQVCRERRQPAVSLGSCARRCRLFFALVFSSPGSRTRCCRVRVNAAVANAAARRRAACVPAPPARPFTRTPSPSPSARPLAGTGCQSSPPARSALTGYRSGGTARSRSSTTESARRGAGRAFLAARCGSEQRRGVEEFASGAREQLQTRGPRARCRLRGLPPEGPYPSTVAAEASRARDRKSVV